MASKRDKSIAARRGAKALSRMDDADACALVEFFLAEVDRAAQAIESAWHDEDAERLRDLALLLKEAASGYGFPEVTKCAEGVEQSLLASEAGLSAAAEQVENLLQTCRKIAADRD